MKRMTMILAGLLLLGMGSNAAADESDLLAEVARDAGVSVDDVRMVLGSRTQHAQYRASFDRKEERIRAALVRVEARQRMAREAEAAARKVASEPSR